MDQDYALVVEGVSKTFYLDQFLVDTLKARLFSALRTKEVKILKALEDITFSVPKGEVFGIIGRNGSGKSTLVKVLSGAFVPDAGGKVIRNGSSMLMSLSIGLSHELTAAENIYVTGSALGLSLKKIDSLFNQIIEFAELGEFVNTKIKYFSSGMIQRLSFSIAVNANAEIMFLDEVFAVGDAVFKKKAVEVLEKSWLDGRTVVMVSHSMDNIKKYCHRVIYLQKGKIRFLGSPEEAIQMYMEDNHVEEEATD
ncbi:MAG: ABC transporter ATP-binding protein [Cyclobacteriaceae bacterium]|nr:ABC transporter ATP-binding protein [Cyclobacteriaceae bacterium]